MIVLIFSICLAASALGGVCGIGGDVVIKPVLDAVGVMSVSTLSFLSGLTVLSMAVTNLWRSRKSRDIDARRGVPIGIGAAIGGAAGSRLFQSLKASVASDGVVGVVQSVLLAILVLGTLLYMLGKRRIRTRNLRSPWVCALIGAALGLLSSFLGIGGGPMNLVVLCYFLSMDSKQAAVNSILIILISQTTNLLMTLVTHTVPSFEWAMFGAMVSAGVLGGLISARLHKKLSPQSTDRLFILMLLVILLICLYNTISA